MSLTSVPLLDSSAVILLTSLFPLRLWLLWLFLFLFFFKISIHSFDVFPLLINNFSFISLRLWLQIPFISLNLFLLFRWFFSITSTDTLDRIFFWAAAADSFFSSSLLFISSLFLAFLFFFTVNSNSVLFHCLSSLHLYHFSFYLLLFVLPPYHDFSSLFAPPP